MLDEFDYKEPICPLSGGKDFYYPQSEGTLGRIPVSRVISKLDACFDKNDYAAAGRLLLYWKNEAVALRDKQGELTIENELVGYYRKQGDKQKGMKSVENALALVDELKKGDCASGATIFVNCATAYKSFGEAEKALTLYALSQEVYKKTLSEDDSRFGALYNNMALALADTGKIQEAISAYYSAIEVMKRVPRGEAEQAITYINLAHLYDELSENEKIKECMDKAYLLLKSDKLSHDGHYAFVLEKCAPSFGYFGREDIYEELKKESDRIYEGS